MQYFIRRGEKTQGPFSREQLIGFANAKKISGADQIGNAQQGPFQELSSVWDVIKAQDVSIGVSRQLAPMAQQEPLATQQPMMQQPMMQQPQSFTPKQPQHNKFCSTCGAQVHEKAELCPKCGIRQPSMQAGFGSSNLNKSKTVAGLFALLLGGFGIHKFYLKEPVAGIFYILFCWTFIPAIIAFIEGIIYLTMSDQDFDRKYGNR